MNKKSVSKKDIASVRSILRKSFTAIMDTDESNMIGSYDTYHGRYHLFSGDYDYFSLILNSEEFYYVVRVLKDSSYNRIHAYRIVSIQRQLYGDTESLYKTEPIYCAGADLIVKELFTTYLDTCPDAYTFDMMYDIKYGYRFGSCRLDDEELETEDFKTEEARAEMVPDVARAEMVPDVARAEMVSDEDKNEAPINIEDVITTNKHTDYNAYRKEKLLSVEIDTLDKLYCLARSFINGRYYNFRYYITDMNLSCCEREDADLPFPTIRDYIACRIHVKSNKSLAVDEEICCYIVIKDERYAETLIYI